MSITIFSYVPGDDYAKKGGTFTRADAATCARYRDSSGNWQTAAANVLRDGHYEYQSSTNVRTTLLEAGRTNSALGSCSFADATYWAGAGAFTIVTATSVIAGQTAYKYTNASVLTQNIGTFVNGQTDCFSTILEAVDGTTIRFGIRDGTAADYVYLVEMDWATLTVSPLTGSGDAGVVNLGTGPTGGKLIRFWIAGTGTAAGVGAAGNVRQAAFYPTYTAAGKSAIIHHAQFEASAKHPSSPIVTVAAAVTRAKDAFSFVFPGVPQSVSLYHDSYWNNVSPAGDTNIVAIGSADERLVLYRNTLNQVYGWHDTTVDVFSSIAGTITYGQRVQMLLTMTSDGKITATKSVNGGAESSGTTSATSALQAAWGSSALILYGVFHATRGFSVVTGVQSLTTMASATAAMGTATATLAPVSVVAEASFYGQPQYTVMDTGTNAQLQATATPGAQQQVRVLAATVSVSAVSAAGTLVQIKDGDTVLWQTVLAASGRPFYRFDFSRKPLRGSKGTAVTMEMMASGSSDVQTIVMTCDNVRAP